MAEIAVTDELRTIVRPYLAAAGTGVTLAALDALTDDMVARLGGVVRASITEPRRWELPPEPGPEVTAVRCDCHAQNWYHDEPQWLSKGYPFRAYRWPGLVANHPRLTDASEERPT